MLSRGSDALVTTEPRATSPPSSVLLTENRAEPARSTAAETLVASAAAGTLWPRLVEMGGALVTGAVAGAGESWEQAVRPPPKSRRRRAATTRAGRMSRVIAATRTARRGRARRPCGRSPPGGPRQ